MAVAASMPGGNPAPGGGTFCKNDPAEPGADPPGAIPPAPSIPGIPDGPPIIPPLSIARIVSEGRYSCCIAPGPPTPIGERIIAANPAATFYDRDGVDGLGGRCDCCATELCYDSCYCCCCELLGRGELCTEFVADDAADGCEN
jgi:hypothetical protein